MDNKAKGDFAQQDLKTETADSNLEATVDEMKSDENLNTDADQVKDVNGIEEIDVKELLGKYNSKVAEYEELYNRFIRLQADFNNFKKRTEKEKENTYQFAAQEIISSLLPVLDNFERALQVDVKESSLESFYVGIEMVYKQFLEALKANGLEEIDALGQKFDHNYHHAVAQEEKDGYEEDIVTEVLLKGYKVKDKVIRPSMVKVSK